MKQKLSGFWQMLQSEKGCRRALLVCICLLLLFSCAASLIATAGGRVVMREVSLDVRGGMLTAELYTPKGVSAADSLPAVLVAHGGSVSSGVMSGISQELARRGFVVLNVNAYGAAQSENPPTDDLGAAPSEPYSTKGIYDAFQYLRGLQYVDPTRVGMAGHSFGCVRVNGAGAVDASWLTRNDLLLNILHDRFGLAISEEELYADADEIAARELSAAEFAHYEDLRAEADSFYDTRVKAILALGTGPYGATFDPIEVEVAGHPVTRYLNTNLGFIVGLYDESWMYYGIESVGGKYSGALKLATNSFFTDDSVANDGTIYAVSEDASGLHSQAVGELSSYVYDAGSAATHAVENRASRVFHVSPEAHSQNFFSYETTSYIVKYFETVLGYNNGELSDPATAPIAYTSIVWQLREVLNAMAMLCMFALLIILAAVLLKKPFFADVQQPLPEPKLRINSLRFWVTVLLIALAGSAAIFCVNANSYVPFVLNFAPGSWFFPINGTAAVIFSWLVLVALASVLVLAGNCVFSKQVSFLDYIRDSGLNLSPHKILKTFCLSAILFLAGYYSLSVIRLLFGMDYRFWLVAFDIMRPDQFLAVLRYFLPLTLIFLVSGVVINSGRMTEMGEGVNTLLNVFLSALGLLVPILLIYSHSVLTEAPPPTQFFLLCFGLPIMTFINSYLSRKLYNLSGSVWLGAFTNAWLVAWMWCSVMESAYLLR